MGTTLKLLKLDLDRMVTVNPGWAFAKWAETNLPNEKPCSAKYAFTQAAWEAGFVAAQMEVRIVMMTNGELFREQTANVNSPVGAQL
jgi:hypothetical protein